MAKAKEVTNGALLKAMQAAFKGELLKAVGILNARMDTLASKDALEHLRQHVATDKHVEAIITQVRRITRLEAAGAKK
jgi:hypothetical protein